MNNEFFPPSEQELEQIIADLYQKLEDERYEEEWIKLHDELLYRQRQLHELTIKNNAL